MKKPLYQQIADDIKEKINNNEFKPGDPIYSENELCKAYHTSRATVRRGLSLLANEGYIYVVHGKGYFVKEPDQNTYKLYYSEMDNLFNSVDNTKLLEVNIILPDSKLIESFKISKNKKIVMIRRLFFIDDEPVAYDKKYMLYLKGIPIVEKEIRYATFPEMVARIVKNTSLFNIKKHLMIYAQMPDEVTKNYLKIDDDQCIMTVEQKLFNKNGKIIGLGETHFKSDYCRLYAESEFADDKW
ncbi:MAG: GntR family transcriptional regulator [Thermacetogeniaceae bacterium]|jgi:GntR family transcriptional regulator|nr:GntR family transcriptional regulator [Syntrophomonadaceae bacterium]